MPLLLATTPYVRTDGIGAAGAAELSRPAAIATVSAALLVALPGLGVAGLAILAASALVVATARLSFLHRLAGVTGDCCGALLELVETAVVLAGALST
jgi:adenosylcobinamide-GDP ribazoletransferase